MLSNLSQVIKLLGDLQAKDSYILATTIVTSLYTIISHQDGYAEVESFLRDTSLLSIQREFILTTCICHAAFLFLILNLLFGHLILTSLFSACVRGSSGHGYIFQTTSFFVKPTGEYCDYFIQETGEGICHNTAAQYFQC